MTDKAIAIYCFFDDFFQKSGYKTDPHCKVNDAQIATTALMAALFFYGNHASAMKYMHEHQGVAQLHKSNFNRRLHGLQARLVAVFRAVGATLKELNTTSRYIIDSFPVAVCRNCRIPVCKLLTNKAYLGYNEAKKEYFYGFKVTLIVDAEGLPVDYYVSAGSFHDSTLLQAMSIDLPAGSLLYGDSGYTDYEQEDLYAECEEIFLRIHRKKNSKRPDLPWQAYLKKVFRKPIETQFSQITNRFARHIHAVSPEGSLLKLFLFVFAFSLDGLIPNSH